LFIDYRLSDKAKQDQYQCLKCGHKWSERKDDGENIVHCVNCNSINTLTKKSVHDPKSKKKISGFIYLGLGGLLSLLGFGMIILTITNWGFMTCQGLSSGLIALSGGIPMMTKYLSGEKEIQRRCLDCGHEWEGNNPNPTDEQE